MLLRCNFFRASFVHPITDTGSMQGHAAPIKKKMETLLNNVFKAPVVPLETWPLLGFIICHDQQLSQSFQYTLENW